MIIRTWIVFLLGAVCLSPALAQEQSPSVRCDGIYCREDADRDWQVRIIGEVTSPAGIYVVVTAVEGHVILRGCVPRGKYASEKPFIFKVSRDGMVGDYLLSIFGTQDDFGGILTPYTDLPLEVYGRTSFQVIRQGPARSRPNTVAAPGGLYFQVTAGAEEVTLTQGSVPWRIHALDGSVIYDVGKDGKTEVNPANKQATLSGTFKGTPGSTYILGHEFFWFHATPQLFLAISPQRWFLPDERLRLDPAWWRHSK